MSTAAHRLGTCAALSALLACISATHGNAEVISDGPNHGGGLQLRLKWPAKAADQASHSRFEVVLDNVGEQDLNVKLGHSLANGKSHHPSALRLLVHSPEGKPRTLRLRETAVAGRMDPFVVPLPAGSTYTLRLRWDQFADPQSGAPFMLTPEDPCVTAELIGEGVTRQEANNDTQGLALVRYWLGKARSNELRLPLAANLRR